MELFHMTFATDGRLPLFPDEIRRRRALRALARVAGGALVLFCLVDDHIHQVLGCTRQRAGRLAQALFRALAPLAEGKLEPARTRPVEGRPHLNWLVRYLLGQTKHHNLPDHPALWTGSCFQDLVGARYIDGLDLSITRWLPRLRLREILPLVGLPAERLRLPDGDDLAGIGLARIINAAGTASALTCDWSSRAPEALGAKAAVAQLAAEAGVKASEVAEQLGVHHATVRRARIAGAPARLTEAVRVRLALEEATGWPGSESPRGVQLPIASWAAQPSAKPRPQAEP